MKTTHIISFIFLTFFTLFHAFGQDQQKAEAAVADYMATVYSDDEYEPLSFGKLFEPEHPMIIQDILQKEGNIKYSVRHSLIVNGREIKDEYFHLDDNYHVIGHFSGQEMIEYHTTVLLLNPEFRQYLDSLGIDEKEFRESFQDIRHK